MQLSHLQKPDVVDDININYQTSVSIPNFDLYHDENVKKNSVKLFVTVLNCCYYFHRESGRRKITDEVN